MFIAEPEAVPEDSFVVTHSNETSISLQWDEPEVTNGVVVAYEVNFIHTCMLPQILSSGLNQSASDPFL